MLLCHHSDSWCRARVKAVQKSTRASVLNAVSPLGEFGGGGGGHKKDKVCWIRLGSGRRKEGLWACSFSNQLERNEARVGKGSFSFACFLSSIPRVWLAIRHASHIRGPLREPAGPSDQNYGPADLRAVAVIDSNKILARGGTRERKGSSAALHVPLGKSLAVFLFLLLCGQKPERRGGVDVAHSPTHPHHIHIHTREWRG